jgi:hypothetical protein
VTHFQSRTIDTIAAQCYNLRMHAVHHTASRGTT